MSISNRTLATLLVIAIIVTIIGTWYSVDRIGKFATLTGYQVTEGNVTLNITQRVEINVTQPDCAFGSGYVTSPAAYAIVRSGGAGDCSFIADSDNWTNTTEYAPDCMEVRNDGNRNVVVNVSSGKTVANMIGGTNPNVTAWSSEKEFGACYTGSIQSYPGAEMDTSNQTMCSCLWPDENFDEIYVGCELTIPDNAYGAKSDTWTFYAAAAATPGDCNPA